MSKKMMLLAAGALTALAFAALPAVASAGSPVVECGGLNKPCGALSISGGTAELQKTEGPRVHCTTVTGTGNYTSVTGGTISLSFGGGGGTCKETAFNSHCTSAGAPSGVINTGTLPFKNVYLTHGKTTPGVTVGPISTPITFTCFGGFVHNVVTGSVLGHLESGCTTHPAGGVLALDFKNSGVPGVQQYRFVTGTGTAENLSSNGAHASQVATGTVKPTSGLAPTVTCV
jgi:hypothetical protein